MRQFIIGLVLGLLVTGTTAIAKNDEQTPLQYCQLELVKYQTATFHLGEQIKWLQYLINATHIGGGTQHDEIHER